MPPSNLAPSTLEGRVPIFSISLVLFASLMDALGFGILLPTLPFFARSLGAGPELITLTMAVYTGGLFLSMPIFGRLSDRFGRKPVICGGLIGVVVCYGALASATSVWMLIVARLAGGVVAGNAAACTAYLIDVTPESERAKYMGLGGALFGLGFVVGPVLGSLLSQGASGTDFVRPIAVAAAMTLLAFLAIMLFLPESHPRSAARGKHEGKHVGGFAERIRRLSPLLLLVMVCHALSGIASGFYETILPLWAADFGLLEGAEDMWILILPGGLGFVLAQAALIGPLSNRFGEARVILVSALPLAALTYGMTIAADLASLPAAICVSGVMAIFAALVIAANHILASRLADPAHRGEVMGLFASVGTVARTLGMIGSGIAYNQLHPHAPYWLAAASTAAIFVAAIRLPARAVDGRNAATEAFGTRG